MSDLSTKQRKAIAALLSEPTIEQAADRVGVNSNTIRRWRQQCPAFVAALDRAETEMISNAARFIAPAAVEAIVVLRSALRDPAPAERRKAAATILRSTPGLRMLGNIEARLTELLGE